MIANVNDFLAAVRVERARQDAKWGEQNHSDFRWAAILGEEFGEVCQAALRESSAELEAELTQVAAVAVAWLECLRRNRA